MAAGQSGFKDKGAVNLVMHLSGYGQDQYQQAVREMAEVFMDKDIIASTLAAHLLSTASREALKIVGQKFEMPKPCQRTWPGVRGFLMFKMKLPETFIDDAHERGIIFSDQRGNCVFARDQDSGVFKIGIGDRPFSQTQGKGGGPFVMPGPDGKVFVTDSPLDALSLKLMNPDSTVLATGGYMAVDKLKPYLHQKEIFLAPSREKIGQQMAKYLSDNFQTARRIQPGQAESWNEYRLLQIKEAKEKKEQEAKQAQAAKVRTDLTVATKEISRSTGLSR